MKKIIALFFALTFVIFNLTACKSTEQKVYTNLFGTEIKIVVNDVKSGKKYKEFTSELTKTLENLNSISTLSGSELSKINNAQVGEKVKVLPETYFLLSKSQDLYHFTNQKFNPAIYPLSALWNFTPDKFNGSTANYTLPQNEDIVNALSHIDFDKLELSIDNGYYVTKRDDIKIDIGGIVKGYAGDLIFELFSAYGYADAYASLGSSSIVTVGDFPVSIRNPLSTNVGDTYVKIQTNDKTAISTSGDYERYYYIDGKKYCHIIDPATGKPIETDVLSATVVGRNSTTCDALSTALCAMSKDVATSFIRDKLSDYSVFIVYKDMTVLTNSNSYTLTNNSFTICKI